MTSSKESLDVGSLSQCCSCLIASVYYLICLYIFEAGQRLFGGVFLFWFLPFLGSFPLREDLLQLWDMAIAIEDLRMEMNTLLHCHKEKEEVEVGSSN